MPVAACRHAAPVRAPWGGRCGISPCEPGTFENAPPAERTSFRNSDCAQQASAAAPLPPLRAGREMTGFTVLPGAGVIHRAGRSRSPHEPPRAAPRGADCGESRIRRGRTPQAPPERFAAPAQSCAVPPSHAQARCPAHATERVQPRRSDGDVLPERLISMAGDASGILKRSRSRVALARRIDMQPMAPRSSPRHGGITTGRAPRAAPVQLRLRVDAGGGHRYVSATEAKAAACGACHAPNILPR